MLLALMLSLMSASPDAGSAPTYCTVLSVQSQYATGTKISEIVLLSCPSADPKKPTVVLKRVTDVS